ncbi:RHS repeat-associated core domain-containing protein [Streptomyces sp. NPDC006356]
MRIRTAVIGAVFAALTAGALPSAYALPPDDDNRAGVDLVDLPPAEVASGQDGGSLADMQTSETLPEKEYEPTKTTAPAPVEDTQAVSGLTAGETVQVGGTPIEVGAPATATPTQAQALEGTWQAKVIDPDTLIDPATQTARDIGGIVFQVTPPENATGNAVIALDHTEFAQLYGADWADRLEFTQFPECFLTTPDVEGCSEPTAVDTRNVVEPLPTDATDDGILDGVRRVEATVDVATLTDPTATASSASTASAESEGAVTDAVFRKSGASEVRTAATAGSGSSVFLGNPKAGSAKGDFSATPLVSAGSWAAGSSSGGFTYSYAMQVPEVPNGPSPSIGFTYNSQVVDGRTSATNNQASWIGDGWEYNPGSITRTYRACRDDTTNGNNADRKTVDLCWGSYNATLTLGGTTTELVLPTEDAGGNKVDPVGDKWVTANGDGSKVELLKNTDLGNGDKDGEYWKVTTRDGTQYFFGRHQLPGWQSGNAVTDSVLTVPVAGNQGGEPCYAGPTKTDFGQSFCAQAWRWNLDYVVDPLGNAMSLWWEKEHNYYAQNLDFKKPVKYQRGGYLKRIDYGQRSAALYIDPPIARVTFGVEERCFAEDGIACTEGNFTSGDWDKTHIWYDTPADLHCSGAEGKECFVPVPSFWSRVRLADVTTQAQRTEGLTTLSKVDSWTLQQSLPAERTDEGTALWLESITRRGYGTDGKSIPLRPVTFVANTEPMPNRVKEGAADRNPTFDRLRIGRIVNEYGGETVVKYKAHESTDPCAKGSGFPKPESNTGLCFPAYWHADPDKSDETINWFNKYVVSEVQELPGLAKAEPVTTSYDYTHGSGGAWALNQAEFSKKKTRTYDQWRGFDVVRTISGKDLTDAYQGTQRSMSEVRYFRGMHDEPLPDGAKRSVTVTDSQGATIAEDKEPFAGRVAETLTYPSAGDATWLTRTVDKPVALELASRTRDEGVPALKAWRVLITESTSHNRSSRTNPDDTRAVRTLRTLTTYDDHGLPVEVEQQGDTGKTGDDTCTVIEYAHNTAKHLIGLDKQTLTTAGTCAQAPTATAADWISGARVAYDNGTLDATPTSGLATTTWDISGNGGGWSLAGTVAYDSLGRVERTTDALGHKDTTTYAPDRGQVYSVTTTNDLGHEEITDVEPGRGSSLKETDANGHTTEFAYDALGRTTAIWSDATRTNAAQPAAEFTYNTKPGEPISVVTSTLKDKGGYEDSVIFYDGLGRERQKQDPAVGDGRLITDIIYSANGTIERTNNAYYAPGSPRTVMFELASDFRVPNATLYSYDGLGRALAETPYEAGSTKPAKATRYEYGADYSTVIKPTGAASQRSFTDALGRVVRVETFTDALRLAHRTTTYEYDERGDQVQAKDSVGNTWSWTYDARGRQTSATDPDTGTTRTTYDVLNRPVTVTDARGTTVWTGYDRLSRPVEQRRTDSLGEPLTKTEYDQLIGGVGLPNSSTRYTDGLAYTTEITGYSADYQPLGKRVKLPESIAMAYGLKPVYAYSYSYSRMGLPTSAALPEVGSLDEENLVVRYNDDGLPVSTSGLDWYTAETSYSPYGEVLRTVSGEHSKRVWTTNLFDESTGELTQSFVDRESTSDTTGVTGTRVNSRTYAYDPAGNVTSIADTSNGATDRQCFTFDALGQLTEAWTAPSACAAPGRTDAAPKYSDGTTNVTAANDGYWQSYTYDALGNRKKLVEHDPSGDESNHATTTYTYGKTDGSQPHTLTGMERTTQADGTPTVEKSAQLTYDAAGNTSSRSWGEDEQALAWTWDGQVEKVTGFGENGAGAWLGLANKCLDLSSSSTAPGTAVQLYSCNGTKAQKLRIDAPAGSADPATGALKVLGKCAVPSGGGTADGTTVVIADCTGVAAQQWKATAQGTLVHSSGKCLTVPGANSASGTDLVLSACTGAAAQSWVPDKETRYVYDGSGGRLMAISATERTLYLGEATVSMSVAGTVAYTERYYAQPGAPTVLRHAMGSGASVLSAQVADQNGTAYVNVELAAGNKTEFSKRDPFGNERDESNNWRSHRSYVGGDDDAASGLVHLGAREYDPTTGRFLSADPVLDLADPVQINGYVYCENNPVTFADPSGLMTVHSGGGGGGGGDDLTEYGGPSASEEAWAQGQLNMSMTDVILSNGWAIAAGLIGWTDFQGCVSKGDAWACGSLLLGFLGGFGKALSVVKAINRAIKAVRAWERAKEKARQIVELARKARELARKAKEAKRKAAEKAAQLKKKAEEAAKTRAAKAAAEKTGNAVQKTKKAAAKAQETVKAGYARVKAKVTGKTSCETGNSFTSGTLVLMADGTTKPIEDVENGDKVLATDPETGETSVETVTAEIEGEGVKRLVKVTVDVDGDRGEKTAEVTATDGHPFWVGELGAWVDAGHLAAGQWLKTSAGTYIQVTAVQRWTAQQATVHNLTVSDLHTYYVLAGATPVLVHNCGTTPPGVQCNCAPGTGAGPADAAIRNSGPWTRSDIIRGSLGLRPNQLGDRIEIHHADQMPGSAIHELDQNVHRGAGTDLHRNPHNQGVTKDMRTEDTQLHWWYRSQEQGWGTYSPDHWFDNWPG